MINLPLAWSAVPVAIVNAKGPWAHNLWLMVFVRPAALKDEVEEEREENLIQDVLGVKVLGSVGSVS